MSRRIKWPLQWHCFGPTRGEQELPEDPLLLHSGDLQFNSLHWEWGSLHQGLASEGHAVIHGHQQRCLDQTSKASATIQRSMLGTRTLSQHVNLITKC